MGLPRASSLLCCGEQPLAALVEPLDTIAAGQSHALRGLASCLHFGDKCCMQAL
jgi:hypothetical protein